MIGRRGQPWPWILTALAVIGIVTLIAWPRHVPAPRAATTPAVMPYAPVTSALTFPDEVATADPALRDLYVFAARRPDVLHYVPCFCGCWRAGHRSNHDCFVKQIRADGVVDIDEMGFT